MKTPNVTRWNSLFDSLKNLLKYKEKLDDLCLALGVAKFNFTEVEYMEEYCSLMEPIADGLDFLQKESNMFYGYFLPTLVTIKVKMRKLYEYGSLSYLRDIAKEMENALVERFKDFFKINPDAYDSVIAAISCPSIKMKFIKPLQDTASIESLKDLQSLFVQYATEFQEETDESGTSGSLRFPTAHGFFDFDQSAEGNSMNFVIKRVFLNLCLLRNTSAKNNSSGKGNQSIFGG